MGGCDESGFMFCHDFRHSYMVINSYMVITINSL
jgi:hypothetical protein